MDPPARVSRQCSLHSVRTASIHTAEAHDDDDADSCTHKARHATADSDDWKLEKTIAVQTFTTPGETTRAPSTFDEVAVYTEKVKLDDDADAEARVEEEWYPEGGRGWLVVVGCFFFAAETIGKRARRPACDCPAS